MDVAKPLYCRGTIILVKTHGGGSVSVADVVERVSDEVASLILVIGGVFLLFKGHREEGLTLITIGTGYLFYRRRTGKGGSE